ncbi:PKD domain-containing protein [bacterium]|nr:PKD domain-containing protein [bacterium]
MKKILALVFFISLSYHLFGLGNINGNVDIVGQEDNSGVIVQLLQTGDIATTNSTGSFEFNNLYYGNYSLIIQKNGCLTKFVDQILVDDNNQFIEEQLYQGDLNTDGIIDILDRVLVSHSLNSSFGEEGYIAEKDFNQDGVIDDLDVQYLITYWNQRSSETLNIIDPEVGGFVVQGNISISFPSGSFEESTQIEITQSEEIPFEASEYNITPVSDYYSFNNEGIQLNEHAIVALKVDSSIFSEDVEIEFYRMYHYYYDERREEYTVDYLPFWIDEDSGLVLSEIDHFSGIFLGVDVNALPTYNFTIPIPVNQVITFQEPYALYEFPELLNIDSFELSPQVPGPLFNTYDHSSGWLNHSDYWGSVHCPPEISDNNWIVVYCSVYDNGEYRVPTNPAFSDLIFSGDSEDTMKSFLSFNVDLSNLTSAVLEFDLFVQAYDAKDYFSVYVVPYSLYQGNVAYGAVALTPSFMRFPLRDVDNNPSRTFNTGDAHVSPDVDDWVHKGYNLFSGIGVVPGSSNPLVQVSLCFQADNDNDRMAGAFIDNLKIVATNGIDVNITCSDTSPLINQNITFNANYSDPIGDLAGYRWDFGDGSVEEFVASSVSSITHSYSSTGSKNVTLTVWDEGGNFNYTHDDIEFKMNHATANDNITINVTQSQPNQAPDTWITNNPGSSINTNSASFSWNGSDPDGYVVGYYYELDDSTPDNWTTGRNVTLNNISPGSHTFFVRAKDDDGLVDPTPASYTFTYTPTPSVQITFTNPSNGSSTSTRIISVEGYLNNTSITNMNLNVNGANYSIAVNNGNFVNAVYIRQGTNTITASVPGYTGSATLTVTGNMQPVDMTSILTWNSATDVDLYVEDPNGEICYYNHQNTAIGGHLDRDDTDGYGPETFTLEDGEVIDGQYHIRVNYYSGSNPVNSSVYTLLNEGAPNQVSYSDGPHTLSEPSGGSSTPTGAWWNVRTVTFNLRAPIPPNLNLIKEENRLFLEWESCLDGDIYSYEVKYSDTPNVAINSSLLKSLNVDKPDIEEIWNSRKVIAKEDVVKEISDSKEVVSRKINRIEIPKEMYEENISYVKLFIYEDSGVWSESEVLEINYNHAQNGGYNE